MLSWNTCCIQSGLCKLSSLSLALSVSVKPYRALSLSHSLRLPLANSPTHHLKVASVCFHMVGKSSASKFFFSLAAVAARSVASNQQRTFVLSPKCEQFSFGSLAFTKLIHPHVFLKNSWRAQMLQCWNKSSQLMTLTIVKDHIFGSVKFEFCDDFITIEQLRSSKQKSIALRLVSSLSHPLFFPPLSWWRIDLNLMMFVMKRKSQTNYIKELWSPVPCLSEHVMIW